MPSRRLLQRPWPWIVAAGLLLVPAVRILGGAAQEMHGWLVETLPVLLDGPEAAVGAAWLAAYLLLNGSVAADVGIVLHHAGVVTAAGLFLLVLGARMGASAIVVVMGGLARLRKDQDGPVGSGSLGVLSFLVTFTVYLPLALLALVIVRVLGGAAPLVPAGGVEGADAQLGRAGLLFLAALVGLWLALAALDAGIRRADLDRLRDRIAPWLETPWRAVGVGLVVTALTTSVAFSLGALVPMYRRQVLTRRQMIPYILGANIGTFSDSLLVAALLGAWEALVVLAVLVVAVAAVTVLALVTYRWYAPFVDRIQSRLVSTRPLLWSALVAILVVPVLLLLV